MQPLVVRHFTLAIKQAREITMHMMLYKVLNAKTSYLILVVQS